MLLIRRQVALCDQTIQFSSPNLYLNAAKTVPAATTIARMRSAADWGVLLSGDKLRSSFGFLGPDAVALGGDRLATQAVLTVKTTAPSEVGAAARSPAYWCSMRRDPDHQAPA
jgi:hypothetical protein